MRITWEHIAGIAGGIVLLFNAGKAIFNITSPIKKLNDKIKRHDLLLDNDNSRLNSIENSNKMMCKSMLALLEHEITGNSVEKLKTTKTELQNFLIDK